MASRISYLVLLVIWIAALWLGLDFAGKPKEVPVAVPTKHRDWVEFFVEYILPSLPVTEEFDTPLRPPDGEGVVITFPYRESGHMGEDWSTAKGDAALGEPVYSVADGWVSVAQDFASGWGKVIFVCYKLPEGRYPPFVEVEYTMLNTMEVTSGQFVKRGQRIGTMGNANGAYKAHLHWEVRWAVGKGLSNGFDSSNPEGWMGPSDFLTAHRGDRFKFPLLPKTLLPAEREGWGTDY